MQEHLLAGIQVQGVQEAIQAQEDQEVTLGELQVVIQEPVHLQELQEDTQELVPLQEVQVDTLLAPEDTLAPSLL